MPGGGEVCPFVPSSAPRVAHVLVLSETACYQRRKHTALEKAFLLCNQAKEWLAAQSLEPTCLVSNPGTTMYKLCDPEQVC